MGAAGYVSFGHRICGAEVLDEILYTLRKYQDLSITHFILSDPSYLAEITRQGDQLLPLLK